MVKELYSSLLDDMTWSYSRLKCFEDCPYRWYLNYILDEKEEPLFYSSYGSFIHSLLEQFYSGKITQDQMLTEYLVNYKKRVLGEIPSEQISQKYLQKGIDYIQNFKPLPYKPVEIEKKLYWERDRFRFVGVIDFLGEKDGILYLVDNKSRDLKARSKRKTPTIKDKELDEMLKQLYLYCDPIYNEYGKYPEKLCFNCFKSGVFIEEPFNIDSYNSAWEWVFKVIRKIKSTENFTPWVDWFACKYICGFHNDCCYFS